MKTIGFVDYYLSEWHANHYPEWLAEACNKLGASYRVAYGWAELDVSPVDGVTTDEWCRAHGVERCATVAELCEKSDMIVVLAPSDPQKHLEYAKAVLPYGKRTYIDKTFAPDLATAKEIFAIAEAHGTPFFSTSALRYATELLDYGVCRQMMTTGSGRSAEEYIIHQAEMIVKKLGVGATRICAENVGDTATLFRVGYEDDRAATMTFGDRIPFTVRMAGGEDRPLWSKVDSAYFQLLMEDMIRFFETGEVSFDGVETLEVMKIREGAMRAAETPDTWLAL